ncbi:UspA domain protein [Denitrovibrio acetiphilus DSM 12809]|uniref:UspA domain protein n=1 Tax=Denitrovibrio acetiphilus (strain DSM 12809 / NBRC 114555 / N2460) TaxID=522772 RepID=D4H7F6_DENA2|nr:universal stress protein [Denitrovibrio acetiphilus]ADD67955.1 UspA domain protein [Denitrovibrio acetiphilus DSM 12809]
MFKPKEILVPTDFSEYSEAALAQAVELAQQFGSKIHLVHVSAQDAEHMPMFFLDDEKVGEVKKHLAEYNKQLMDAKIEKFIKGKNVNYETHFETGSPYDKILKLADILKVDLIVISSKGKNALEGFFTGSTTEKVVRKANCCVFLVRKVLQ